MSKEKLLQNITKNKEKVRQLQQKIKDDEQKLEALNTAEIKMLMNEIDATGRSTKDILKAIKAGNIEAVNQLLRGDQEDEK